VHHVELVAVGHARNDHLELLARHILLELACALDDVLKIAPLCVLHHQKQVRIRLDHLLQPYDVRVVE